MKRRRITLVGWNVNIERDSEWHVKHKEANGLCNVDVIEVDGEPTEYAETDCMIPELYDTVYKYPSETYGLKRFKKRCEYVITILADEFDPKKLCLNFTNVIVKKAMNLLIQKLIFSIR